MVLTESHITSALESITHPMSCWSVSGEIGGSFLGEHPSNVEINKIKKIRNNFITSFVNENNKKTSLRWTGFIKQIYTTLFDVF
jgi:hypothetical protein